ncbi:4-coumarate--CoA ligase family protein [Pararhodobacter marinus]|uniref:4-coumarate--CoA ligase family protein n=2 Tax=Pararhodobacter marinus TaxID=2184063 RepID=A0A2U2C9B8_9RHOB|nr:AMP-binding protein [Pararhodobacter marinus]PWE28475.1 4-coumarate--CoA ligase family protein [Pararhodobacter marinus]
MIIIHSPHPDVPLRDLSVTECVFEGIARDHTVLIDGPSGRQMSGREVMDAVKRLAGGLIAKGYAPGGCVAIMAPNMPEFCTLFHAVAWAGGTVTPVNPTYTAHELNHQLVDAGATLLITAAPFLATARDGIKGTGVREIIVIGPGPDGANGLDTLMGEPLGAQSPVDPDTHVVALPYSSGTTGLPKGVMLTHRNLVANFDQTMAIAPLDAGETTIAFLPFFHIYGLQVLMNFYLGRGGTLITMPRFDLEQFLTLAQKHRTPRMWIVPPVALALAKHPMVDNFDLSHVVQINSAAAPLGADIAEAMGARIGTMATQGYGMTELSPVSHVSPKGKGRAGASGVTIPNTQCRIVDPETLQDCPKGTDGELWVKGPQVMKGYLNRPEATAETIVEGGWLRTGDIAHVDADGYLYITDRLKELIKVKGFQVAPAELEALLVTHPAITDAAVIGVPDAEAGEVPMAFITAQTPPTLAEIQAHLDGEIAHYKQIRHLAVIEAIPKSASGKILRRVLRDRVAQKG